jgi:hypothetical protein
MTHARLETRDGRRPRTDKRSAVRTGVGVAVTSGDPDATSVCSACGSSVADDNVTDTNGWRWYSDGEGGLRPLCATCPAPTASVAQDA